MDAFFISGTRFSLCGFAFAYPKSPWWIEAAFIWILQTPQAEACVTRTRHGL